LARHKINIPVQKLMAGLMVPDTKLNPFQAGNMPVVG
jgi:hypothetical protein